MPRRKADSATRGAWRVSRGKRSTRLGAALDLTDVNGMEVGTLGKLLLGEPSAVAELPDVASNSFATLPGFLPSVSLR